MEIAQVLMEEGFDIAFPDLEGNGRVDFLFTKGRTEGEIECKSLSADAGRKIHRTDFHRFIDEISGVIMSRFESGAKEVLVVTVADRFPREHTRQRELLEAANRVLSEPAYRSESSGWFTVERRPLDVLGTLPSFDANEINMACRRAFGETCHAAGPVIDSSACLVVVCSQQEDDTSKPLLDAMKKAHHQLSPNRPGFIAVQFNDIGPQYLELQHLRKRAGILSGHLFGSRNSSKLAGVYFCAYAGMQAVNRTIGVPAFVCLNPTFTTSGDELPFRSSITNGAFMTLIDD